MADYPKVDPEIIKELYQFTVVKKVLMRKYSWIKDVRLSGDDINKYSLIFLDIVIDPWLAAKENDWVVKWYVNPHRHEYYPYLGTFFTNSEQAREMNREIERIMDKVHTSPAIPQEFKLPSKRKFQPGTYSISQDATPIPEYTERYNPRF